MPNIKVNWTELLGRQLHTITGVPFKVVRVSATHVAVRPARGTRDYALSISRELEPAAAAYTGGNLPPPAALAYLGIRPVLLSYAWGILKAVVQDKIGVRVVERAHPKDFAGTWLITSLADMDDDYLEEGAEAPVIRLHAARQGEGWSGTYALGLSSGSLEGSLREFGGELVLIFGYEGADEMEPASGGGWLQLLDGALAGEFIGALGCFTARRPGRRSRQRR